MRALIVTFLFWAGALQARGAVDQLFTIGGVAQVFSIAVALTALTAAVYRLGIWRQEMANTKHDIGTEVARCREETTRGFMRVDQYLARIDQRFDTAERTMGRFVHVATERRVATERWQAGVDAALRALAGRMDRLEQKLETKLEQEAA